MILAVAVLCAVAVGLATGGSLRQLALLPLQWGWIALAAFFFQLYIIYFPEPLGQGLASPRAILLMSSYILLLVVMWRNRALPGIWLMGAGLCANLLAMLLNGGYMPISPEALEQVGRPRSVMTGDMGARVRATKDIVLPREATVAWWLTDIFVLPPPFPIPSVFSLGDVAIAIGAFWLVQSAMHSRPTKAA